MAVFDLSTSRKIIKARGLPNRPVFSQLTHQAGIIPGVDSSSILSHGTNVLVIPTPDHYWTLDDVDTSGSTATDIVGASNGTIVGATTGATGQVGEAYNFSGANDYVDLGNALDPGTGSFSVSCWIKGDSFTGLHRILDNRGTGGNGTVQGWFLRVGDSTGDRELRFHVDSGSGDVNFTASTTKLNAGQWYHVVAAWDSVLGRKYVYIDGAQDWTSQTANLIGTDLTSTTNGAIGLARNDLSQEFSGEIDDVAYFPKALTPWEVSEIYAKGLAGDRLV